MALSQIQCLDDNNVNPRTNESKPDFLYSEDQRLALEVLLREGRDAFFKFVEERQMRSFLSDLELETLTKTVEPYDPGSELFPEDADENEPPLSVHYWPELSDISIPQMDLGWPHTDAYRGVTRTTVYTQPPLEGQTHIKEIVRRMIAHAQKMIAVVMDVFTDVDIFRDLLDAGFRRKVAIYILLESTSLPHFLSMCQRANMHAGHLKHLRVRCTEGMEFYTRSCTKVKGQLGHRFMFIDGDKAVSGSFSFTWTSSRLDKNLVTVVTGQAVEAFDQLFRHLYASSTFVDLQQVTMEPEPEREPLPQLTPVVLPSATVTRKLYNPKYALLIGDSTSAEQDTPKESQTPEVPDAKKRKRGRGSKELVPEEDCTHPGLINLEKANLIPYLPTWPDPDPASDVIGFINIMDTSKPTQVHLQRSERFETSQAIRFTNPLTMPKEPPPEVAKPKEISSAIEDKTKPSPSQDRIMPSESIYDRLHRVDSTNTKSEKVEQHSVTSRFEQTIHRVSPTGQNEGQITKRMSPLSGNIDRISRSSAGNLEHALEQKLRIAPQTETSSSLAKQVSNLPSTGDSNLGTEYTETKTTPHLTRANHTQPFSTSKTSLNSHTHDTSHLSPSSPSSPNHPTPKPHTVHSATKDRSITNGLGAPNTSTHKKLNSPTADRVASHKSTGENTQETVHKTHDIINRKTEVQKDDRTSGAFQNKQKESAADSQNNESVGLHDGKGGTPAGSGNTKQIQSGASATLTPNRDKKITSGDIKTAKPVDRDGSSKPPDDLVKVTSRQLTDPKSPQTLNETQSEMKTYHIKENKPQRITYSQSSPLTMWERIQAATVGLPSDGVDDTSARVRETTANSPKKNTRRVSQDGPQSPKEKTVARQPEKAVQSAERQLGSTASDRRTSDDFPPSLPPPALSPELRTPTSDISDGYRSREDSNRSTTSEDHVGSCGSQSKEHVIDRVTHSGHSTADHRNPEDDQSNKSNQDATSPMFIDYSAYVALFDNKNKHASSKESQGLERKVKMRDKEDVKSKDGGIRKTLNRDSKGKEGRNGNEESKPKPFEKEKETSNQALLRKSRTQRAPGSSNAENRDGSAREVAGQKRSSRRGRRLGQRGRSERAFVGLACAGECTEVDSKKIGSTGATRHKVADHRASSPDMLVGHSTGCWRKWACV
ncbi:nucleolar protein dao-5-like [Hippocampus zosterae]|uniref:nucleolar protein dao-5-like n=1 Tax=Hippocampus zosterae TaxID=109293 RepID=UPI00223D8595|nr:nucleolar protein dao-5-like [Hippocampus zosterae]